MTSPVEPHAWSLRYAPHLGYIRGVPPLFSGLAGSEDVAAQLRFIAQCGFDSFLHPWLPFAEAEEQKRVMSALLETPLQSSCVVATTWREMKQPIWVQGGAEARGALLERVRRSASLAARIGSGVLAVIIAGEPGAPYPEQVRRAAFNLRGAADAVAEFGVMLAIEPNQALPGMLLSSFDATMDLIADVDRANVKLIFDTAHASVMCADALAAFNQCFDQIALIQIVDGTNRVEPGAGGTDFPFVELLASALRRGYSGLVDLEYGWARPSIESERRGLADLQALDSEAARLAAL